MKVKEVIADQYLRILALEETLGKREVEISLLKEQVMKLTPTTVTRCELCNGVDGQHSKDCTL